MNKSAENNMSAATEQMTADLQATSTELLGVPREIAEAAKRAGFQTATGTIAFAGQTASGSYSVQFNAQNGSGYSSSWPHWAFALAKDALLGNKRVWVSSNGDPFGANLVFVLIFA